VKKKENPSVKNNDSENLCLKNKIIWINVTAYHNFLLSEELANYWDISDIPNDMGAV